MTAYTSKDLQVELRAKADQGNAEAQLKLGEVYKKSKGVAIDGAEAAKWYRKAAAQGYADAQGILGYKYANGLEVSGWPASSKKLSQSKMPSF